MSRLTDDDKHFGPITWGHTGPSWRPFRLVWSSGGEDDEESVPRNALYVGAFGVSVRIWMPNIVRPYRIKHWPKWDAATIERLGRNYYYEIFPREYGISIADGFLQLFIGRQTHDSISTQIWCCHLPWTQWRHVRFSLYRPDGTHFWTQLERKGVAQYEDQRIAEEACPKVAFDLDDFDGQRIRATCHVEEREWRFGQGWFKWLSLFRRAKIRRYLNLSFDKEVGPEKGSWKGGTIGTSTEMLPGESCEAAFRRYCEQDHRSKYRRFKVQFVGAVH